LSFRCGFFYGRDRYRRGHLDVLLKLCHEARNALKYSGLGHCSATLGEAA
jgi:hypothetical protein